MTAKLLRFLVATLLVLGIPAGAQAQETVAMLSVHGDIEAAEVFVAGANSWQPAYEVGPALFERDSVRVGHGAEAVLLYRDGRTRALTSGAVAMVGTSEEQHRTRLTRLADTARGAMTALFDLVARDADGPAPTRLVAMQSRGVGAVGPRLLLAEAPAITAILPNSMIRWDGRVWGNVPVRIHPADSACVPTGEPVFEGAVDAREVPLENWSEPARTYRISLYTPAGEEATSACFRTASAGDAQALSEQRALITASYADTDGGAGCPVASLVEAALLADEGYAYDAILHLEPLVEDARCPLAAHLQSAIATAAEMPHAAP